MAYHVVAHLDSTSTFKIQKLFGCAWWTKDRSVQAIQKMLLGSVCLGVCDSDGELVGFARAITDGVFKAIVVDVIVVPEHRGRGLAKLLMDALFSHSALSDIQDFELYCQPGLAELYGKWGFEPSPNGVIFMRAKRTPPDERLGAEEVALPRSE